MTKKNRLILHDTSFFFILVIAFLALSVKKPRNLFYDKVAIIIILRLTCSTKIKSRNWRWLQDDIWFAGYFQPVKIIHDQFTIYSETETNTTGSWLFVFFYYVIVDYGHVE